jgi:hypothetical protein
MRWRTLVAMMWWLTEASGKNTQLEAARHLDPFIHCLLDPVAPPQQHQLAVALPSSLYRDAGEGQLREGEL